jgi:predicted  nucleic acid-binding Zn-ribbon protein
MTKLEQLQNEINLLKSTNEKVRADGLRILNQKEEALKEIEQLKSKIVDLEKKIQTFEKILK